MDTQLLYKIGLTEGESKVYLALLKLGSSTTGPIVDEAKVSRSKVYHIIERLIEKGLLTSIIKSKTKYFQAADPSKILDYLARKEEDIQNTKKEVKQSLPLFEQYMKSGTREEAEIYSGLEGVKTARELVFKTLKKGDMFYCLGANKVNLAPLQAYWKDFHRRRSALGIKAKYLIQEDSREEMGKGTIYKSHTIESRYLDLVGPVHIDIFGDYVVTCILQGAYTSFLIKNKFVADYYRSYFDKAWKLAKE